MNRVKWKLINHDEIFKFKSYDQSCEMVRDWDCDGQSKVKKVTELLDADRKIVEICDQNGQICSSSS